MKQVIHVHQAHVKHNAKHDDKKPVLTIKTYKENVKADEAKIVVNGEVIGKFIYSPDKPLSCGAKVWFESDSKNVQIVTD